MLWFAYPPDPPAQLSWLLVDYWAVDPFKSPDAMGEGGGGGGGLLLRKNGPHLLVW